MELLTNTSNRLCDRTAVTIGKFDGLHLGHRKLVEAIQKEKENGLASLVLSLRREKEEPLLYTRQEKRRLCEALSIDYLAEYTLDAFLRGLSPEQFVRDVLKERLQASVVVVGEDFRFGCERSGDVTTLKYLASVYDFRVVVVEKLLSMGKRVSSSSIRALLKEGAMQAANELLGAPFFLIGTVVHGKHLGRTLGFPTINFLPDDEKLLPRFGVYHSRVHIKGRDYTGVTNIGMRPTVEAAKRPSVETYLLDCEADFYGETGTIYLLDFIREECRFDNVEDLKQAVKKDIAYW